MSVRTLFALAFAIATAGAANVASAETTKYYTKGAYATAYSDTAGDCSYSSTYVSANESVTRQGRSGPITSSAVYISSYSYNYCEGLLSEVSGSGEGQVVAGKSSTTVNASVPVYDYFTGETSIAEVALTFSANGEYSSKGSSNNTTNYGGLRVRSRYVGTTESADVSGSLIVNGVDLINGAILSGEFGKSTNGEVTFTKRSR